MLKVSLLLLFFFSSVAGCSFKEQKNFIRSRPENLAFQGKDNQRPLSIPPKNPKALAWVGSIVQPVSSDACVWDFGQVKEGEVLKHTFTLKNTSAKTLIVTKVNTSCGCTASEVKKKIVLSGESTAIEVEFNTKGYSGPRQQYVYVHTDSLDNPIIKFTIKANIVKIGGN